jgi:hypothetical protein
MSFVALGVAAVGGTAKLIMATQGRQARIQEQRAANSELARRREAYDSMQFTNPYANLENTYEDLTINQQQAEFEAQQFAQSQANIMQGLQGAAGGSGIAGLAQSLANQGALQAQRSSASIGQQEAQNQRMRAQQEAQNQRMSAQGQASVERQRNQMTLNQLQMAAGRKQAADQARTQAATNQMAAIGDIAGGVAGGIMRGKANIEGGGSFWNESWRTDV